MTTQYYEALADVMRAYERWTPGQQSEANVDFIHYQAAGGRSSWPLWLARYRYDYEFPTEGDAR